MNPGAMIQKWFPQIKWTGGSNLHRSYCKQTVIPYKPPATLIHALKKGKVGEGVYKLLTAKFTELSWQINEEEFSTLFYADCYRHMVGDGDTSHPTKLVNPATKSVFHRIAVADTIVGGIRFWCDPVKMGEENGYHFGFRFRLECVEGEDKASVRAQAEASYEDATAVEIAEPVNEPADPIPVGEWLQ